MNIVMATNNYLPHVGGVARSVVAFTSQYRAAGHRVVIVAPHFKRQAAETDLIAVPSLQTEFAQDMAMPLPIPGIVAAALQDSPPDIVHAHHPFLLGSTALLTAARYNVPLVFTHHTMYEHYTHYSPVDSPQLKQYVIDLSTGYANLCACVFAPTKSVANIIKERGVTAPIEVVPTGIDTTQFTQGNGAALRWKLSIPSDAFVIGHVGRLAPEKNVTFLIHTFVHFLNNHPTDHALIVGDGESLHDLKTIARDAGLTARIHFTGTLQNTELIDAYHAMDLFGFSSLSDTQGLVLLEALASGVPVVALDAPGARDIITPGENGWLVATHNEPSFGTMLQTARKHLADRSDHFIAQARHSAAAYDTVACAARALHLYESLIANHRAAEELTPDTISQSPWFATQRLLTAEGKLWLNRLSSAYSAWQTL